jgi:hypothetical protein
MALEGKLWGASEVLFATPDIKITRIVVRPRGFCSLHYHACNENHFLVIAGFLDVLEWPKLDGVWNEAAISSVDAARHHLTSMPGSNTISIRPLRAHLFWNPNETVDVIAYELYTRRVAEGGIVSADIHRIARYTLGGVGLPPAAVDTLATDATTP